MSSPDLAGIFAIGIDILKTSIDDETSKIQAQLGSVVGEVVDTDNAEWWQHVGFSSRPPVPVAGKQAAQAVVIKRSDHDVCVASQDLRGLEIYGNLADGETCVYGPGADGNSQGRALFKDDGSVTLLTTNDNTPTGKVVALKIAPDSFTFTAPWGSFKFDASGFHLKTKAGPRIDMGGLDLSSIGIPASVSGALTGYIDFTAPTINLKGGICNLGVGPSFATCLAAPSALLAPGAPSTPIMSGPTSQCATVRISTP